MRTLVWLGCGLLIAGCEGGGVDLDPDDNTFDTRDLDGDGTPEGEPDELLTGDLSTGSVIDIGWADDTGFFCWPSTENANFSGNHVFFPDIDKEGSGNIVVQVDPDPGVDVSLYTLEWFANDAQTPPDLTSTSRCEAGFDQTNDSNPGDREIVGPLQGFSDRVLFVGVAGANGATTGAFTVGVWRLEGGIIDDTE